MHAVLVLLLAVSVYGDAPKPTPKGPPAPDATVQSAIQARFAKSKISQDNFRVSVKSGVATLEGKTEIPQRKGVATRLAKLGGARGVVNNIQISEAARKKLSDRLKLARAARALKPKVPKPVTAKLAAPKPASVAAAAPQPKPKLTSVPPARIAPPPQQAAAPSAPARLQIKH